MRIHACKRRLKSLKMSSVLLPLNVRPVRGDWSSSCGATGIAKIWWMNRSKDRHNKYFIFTVLLVIQSSLDARQWSTDWGSKAWSGRSDRRVVRGLFSLCEKSTLFAPQWLPWNFGQMWVLVNVKVNQFLKLFANLGIILKCVLGGHSWLEAIVKAKNDEKDRSPKGHIKLKEAQTKPDFIKISYD